MVTKATARKRRAAKRANRNEAPLRSMTDLQEPSGSVPIPLSVAATTANMTYTASAAVLPVDKYDAF